MSNGTRWVGLDVHASQTACAVFDDGTGEVITRRFIGRPHEVMPFLVELAPQPSWPLREQASSSRDSSARCPLAPLAFRLSPTRRVSRTLRDGPRDPCPSTVGAGRLIPR